VGGIVDRAELDLVKVGLDQVDDTSIVACSLTGQRGLVYTKKGGVLYLGVLVPVDGLELLGSCRELDLEVVVLQCTKKGQSLVVGGRWWGKKTRTCFLRLRTCERAAGDSFWAADSRSNDWRRARVARRAISSV